MQENKINWYIVNKEYINYLRKFDKRVQNIEYANSVKPYIGIVFGIRDFKYYVPISSIKPKHYEMSDRVDFIKIVNKKEVLSVINLNNMIPIPEKEIKLLKYASISDYFIFENEIEKNKYISLLRKELAIINNKEKIIRKQANKLYQLKYNFPKTKIAERCCDFNLLEQKCKNYKSKEKNANKF